MTVNVKFDVPPHVPEVHVWFEDYTADAGWALSSDSPRVIKSGQGFDGVLHSHRRITMIQEVNPALSAPPPESHERLVTINEHAHGHEDGA